MFDGAHFHARVILQGRAVESRSDEVIARRHKAIDAIVQVASTLLEFNVHAITEGIDALGQVTVRIAGAEPFQTMDAQRGEPRVRTFGGYGADTDIIVAAAKAYLSALDKLVHAQTAR